jgi:hypothetical protein
LRKEEAKFQFRIFISLKKGGVRRRKLDKEPDNREGGTDSDFAQSDVYNGFYLPTMNAMRDEVHRIFPFVDRDKITAMQELWDKCSTITHDKFAVPDAAKNLPPKGTDKPPDEMLMDFLNEFDRLAR